MRKPITTLTWPKVASFGSVESRILTEVIRWAKAKYALTDKIPTVTLLADLQKDHHWEWANWLLVHCLTSRDAVAYAVYASTQVLMLYEQCYPDDPKPRRAIEAASAYLDHHSESTKAAVAAAMAQANAAMAAVVEANDSTLDAITFSMAAQKAAMSSWIAIREAGMAALMAEADSAEAVFLAIDATDSALAAARQSWKHWDNLRQKILGYGCALLQERPDV